MNKIPEKNPYTKGVDFVFLKAMGIKVVMYQLWQIGLFYEDLAGKYVWYPRKGTLMFNSRDNNINIGTKVGFSGDFRGEEDKTEEVYNILMEKVFQQGL